MYRYEQKMIELAKRWKDYPEWIVYGGTDAAGTLAEYYCEDFYSGMWSTLWENDCISKDKYNDEEYAYHVKHLMVAGKTQEEAEEAIDNGERDEVSMTDDWDEDDYRHAINAYQTNYHFSLMTVQEVLDKYGIEEEDDD